MNQLLQKYSTPFKKQLQIGIENLNEKIKDKKEVSAMESILAQKQQAQSQPLKQQVVQPRTKFLAPQQQIQKQVKQPPKQQQQQQPQYQQQQQQPQNTVTSMTDFQKKRPQIHTPSISEIVPDHDKCSDQEEIVAPIHHPFQKTKLTTKQPTKVQKHSEEELPEISGIDDTSMEIEKEVEVPCQTFTKNRVNGRFVSTNGSGNKQENNKPKKAEKLWSEDYTITEVSYPKKITEARAKRKWILDFVYTDSTTGKEHHKKVRFGRRGVLDFIEHKDKNTRERCLNNLRNPTNPFKANFWTWHLLNQDDDLQKNYMTILNQINS